MTAQPLPAAAQEDRVPLAGVARLCGGLLARYVRLVAATSRFSGPPITQEQVIFAIWHESNLAACTAAWRLRRNQRVISFSTRGFRGIVMNSMLEAMGSAVVALPEEGNKAEAGMLALELARIGQAGESLVISCDGPLGPYRVAKPGILLVARQSGVPIQPWAVSCRPMLRLKGRWDRYLVPLPFGRMRVEQGTQIEVAARAPVKARLPELQAELNRVQEIADRRMTNRQRVP